MTYFGGIEEWTSNKIAENADGESAMAILCWTTSGSLRVDKPPLVASFTIVVKCFRNIVMCNWSPSEGRVERRTGPSFCCKFFFLLMDLCNTTIWKV